MISERRERKLKKELWDAVRRGQKLSMIALRELRDTVGFDELDESGESLLFVAIRLSNEGAVRALLEHGAGSNRKVRGIVPWHAALEIGNVEIVALLVEFGANFHLRDRQGRSGAEIAEAFGHFELATKFAKWEAVLKHNIPPVPPNRELED